MGKRRSLNPHVPRYCEKDRNKYIYRNRKAARSAGARRRKSTSENITEYVCRFGSHFHIGHDYFNKDQKPNFNNSRLANRKVTEVPAIARPASVQAERPKREKAPTPSLAGTVVRKLVLERKEVE